MNLIRFAHLLRSGCLMTIQARVVHRHLAVFLGRFFVELMASQTSDIFFARDNDVSNIFENVPISGIYSCYLVWGKIDFEIAKQIVAGDKIVWIRQAGAFRFAAAHVALCANRRDNPGGVRCLLRQMNQFRILGMLRRHVAVAREAIEREASCRGHAGIL